MAFRTEFGLLEADLVPPSRYKANPTQALDEWPLVAVDVVRAARVRRREHTLPDTVVYDVTYTTRVYVWVNENEWDRALEARDDLTGALRRLLLDRQTLKVPGDIARVLEETLIEEYSDVTAVKGGRYVAGAYVAFDLELEETLTRAPSGTVARVVVQHGALPHPAL